MALLRAYRSSAHIRLVQTQAVRGETVNTSLTDQYYVHARTAKLPGGFPALFACQSLRIHERLDRVYCLRKLSVLTLFN